MIEKYRKELETVEMFLNKPHSDFMDDVFNVMRRIVLRQLLAAQLKEFSYG